MSYANLLTEEQKEAFRKGDEYYVSPFKNIKIRSTLISVSVKKDSGDYTTTSLARIHEARMDKIASRQWN